MPSLDDRFALGSEVVGPPATPAALSEPAASQGAVGLAARFLRVLAVSAVLTLSACASGYEPHPPPADDAPGLMSLVPTTLLIPFVPAAGEEWRWDPVQQEGFEHPVSVELQRRLDQGMTFEDWQWKLLLTRARVIRTRPRWPSEEPLAVSVVIPRWAPYCQLHAQPTIEGGAPVEAGILFGLWCGNHLTALEAEEAYQVVGPVAQDQRQVRFAARLIQGDRSHDNPYRRDDDWENPRTLWSGDLTMPIQIVEGLDEAVTPDRKPTTTEALRRALDIRVGPGSRNNRPTDELYVWVSIDPIDDEAGLRDLSVHVLIDFQHDGEIVDSVPVHVRSDMFNFDLGTRGGWGRVNGLTRRELKKAAASGRWTLRIRGTSDRVLRDFGQSRYWLGEMNVPLANVARSR